MFSLSFFLCLIFSLQITILLPYSWKHNDYWLYVLLNRMFSFGLEVFVSLPFFKSIFIQAQFFAKQFFRAGQ